MIDRLKRFKWQNDPMSYVLVSCLLFLLIGVFRFIAHPKPDYSLVIGTSLMLLVCLFALVMKNTAGTRYFSRYRLLFDGKEIHSFHPTHDYGSVKVDDIIEIGVLTTDEGPIAPDVWIMLSDRNGLACTFPSDAEGHKPVIELLLKFEGFDHRTFIEAMGSTSNAKCVVWQ
ncbi:MAG TPA: hypothetical protein PLL25_05950 [Flavobacteriales bacterium]|mgnify:FL=1|nr:hypothetical protein [Flavobacteriales bacterium]